MKPRWRLVRALEGEWRSLLRVALRPGVLSRKLALRVILFSSTIALLITAVDLGRGYVQDVQQIDGRMAQIRDAYLESITENVWVYDRDRIETQLLGITRLPDFVSAEIRVKGKTVFKQGDGQAGTGVVQVFPLERIHQGREQRIGELVVQATHVGALRRVMQRAAFELVSNGGKTFLVAIFLFVVYYRLIGMHLEQMARYARTHGHAQEAAPLVLPRKDDSVDDELSGLATAINDMRGDLLAYSRQQQEQLKLLGEQAALLDLAYDAIVVFDMDDRIQYWNRGAEDTYGWTAQEALGKNVLELLYPENQGPSPETRATLKRTGSCELEAEHVTRSGARIVVASRCALKRNELGEPLAVLEINRDITERHKIEQQLDRLAHFDILTNLPNRLMLSEQMDEAIGGAGQDGLMVAVMFVDLDRFKQVNDTFGHATGDQLLVHVAQRLKGCVRETDIVGRLSGDEFVVVLTQLKNEDVVPATAEKIRDALGRPFAIGADTVHVGCSVGVAFYPRHGDNAHALLKQADAAMYEAKSQGRGAVRVCEAEARSPSLADAPVPRTL